MSVRALYLDKDEGCYAYVDGPRIDICAYGVGMKVPVNRCPMCGRDLREIQAYADKCKVELGLREFEEVEDA